MVTFAKLPYIIVFYNHNTDFENPHQISQFILVSFYNTGSKDKRRESKMGEKCFLRSAFW